MPANANQAAVRLFLQGEDSPDHYAELFAPGFVGHGPRTLTPEPVNREGRLQATLKINQAFPDLEQTIEVLFAEGDFVAAVMTLKGHHRGEFQGLPPTGKEVTFGATLVFRFADGKIVEEWANLDLLALLQQVGALPAPGQGGIS